MCIRDRWMSYKMTWNATGFVMEPLGTLCYYCESVRFFHYEQMSNEEVVTKRSSRLSFRRFRFCELSVWLVTSASWIAASASWIATSALWINHGSPVDQSWINRV